jgi:phage terminase large subunit-like protein
VALFNFWVPAGQVDERWKRDRVPYSRWVDEGFMEAIPGNAIDQAVLRIRVRDVLRTNPSPLQVLHCDPRDSAWLMESWKADGFKVEKQGQGYAEYNEPTKDLEREVLDELIAHFGNPVGRWNAGNVVIAKNVDGDIMPSKGKSGEKIDGIAGLVMAKRAALMYPSQVALPPVHHVVGKRGAGGPGRSGGREILGGKLFK